MNGGARIAHGWATWTFILITTTAGTNVSAQQRAMTYPPRGYAYEDDYGYEYDAPPSDSRFSRRRARAQAPPPPRGRIRRDVRTDDDHAAYFTDRTDRAQQAVRHASGPLRKSSSSYPRGYRPRHERLMSAQQPESAPLEPEAVPTIERREPPGRVIEQWSLNGRDDYMLEGEIAGDRHPAQPYYEDGYYEDGYYEDGYHEDGYYEDGYHEDGYHEDGYHEDGYHEDGYYEDGYYEDGPCTDGGCCDAGYCCDGYGATPLRRFLTLRHSTIFGGVQGFTNAFNLGGSGSFGFHQGINYGAPLPFFPYSGLGAQLGCRFTQSNLSGSDFSRAQRNQSFYTVGVFRRTDWGLQGGLVYDWLRDDWYDTIDLGQIRGEISYKFPATHEWGFWFTASGRTDTTDSPIVDVRTDIWATTDLYAFFYRRRLAFVPGGMYRFYAGFTGDSDGLIGANSRLPVSDALSLASTYTYLVPSQPTGPRGASNEGWNVALSLVWDFGRGAHCECASPFTPLLDVADNGTFFVDQMRFVPDNGTVQ